MPESRKQKIAEITKRHVLDFYVKDPERAFEDYADDAIMHIYGDNTFSGIWRGKDEIHDFYATALKSLGIRLHLVGDPEIVATETLAAVLLTVRVAAPATTAEWDRLLVYRFDEDMKLFRLWLHDDNQELYDHFAGISATDRETLPTRLLEPEPSAQMTEQHLRNKANLADWLQEIWSFEPKRQARAVAEHVHDDVVMHIYGNNALSGMWRGKHQALEQYIHAVTETFGMALSMVGEPTIRVANRLGVAHMKIQVKHPGSADTESERVVVFRLDEAGKITELWLHEDDETTFDRIAGVIEEKHSRDMLQAT